MATVYVEQKPYRVDPDQSMLQACLSLGFDLPYFCWHPAMGSVGACRQCAVKQFRDEHDTRGKLVVSCMTPASDGTRISIDDPEAVRFRAAVIEGLMLSHPHDCPVCDEGGECHLQDMTVMTGHDYRRYRFPKRTFRNQYLGPFVNHEMNRCIQCYRCVRFYREYAGGNDFNAFGLRNLVFFGRSTDGVLESEFAGNLVEVCPTGVFTDATLKRHYTRKWDLQMAPSICVHCGLGCNTTAGERYGIVRRIVNRYNHAVNGYFLCDRGRFGYEFTNGDQRVREAQLRRAGQLEPVAKTAAAEHFGALLSAGKAVIGIGSPRATLEANFALRALVGPDRFYAGSADAELGLISTMLDLLRGGGVRPASLHDAEVSDAVLILGEDVPNVAPRLALALRQSVRQRPMRIAEALHIPLWLDHAVRDAVQEEKGPLFIAAPDATRLDDVATQTYRAAPDDVARLGFAVAHALDARAPAVPDLPEAVDALAERIAQALRSAARPLVVSGPSCGSEAVVHAAANVALALCRGGGAANVSFTMPESNSLGVAFLGGGTLSAAFEGVRRGDADTVVILENDLYRRAPQEAVNAFFDQARHVVVIDHLANRTTARAELILPAGTFAEADGTLVNSEGRAQRSFQVFVPEGDIQESWRWLRDGMLAAGREEAGAWRNLDDVVAALSATIPALAGVREAAPGADFRIAGAKLARQPHRASGRTAVLADIDVHEPAPPDDPDSALSFSMEGSPRQGPAALTPFFWSAGWNSIQAVKKFQQEVNGPLRGGDAGVRLLEAAAVNDRRYGGTAPAAFVARPDAWLLVPLWHAFGSEELSRSAPAVAELVPGPYVALNASDASRLQANGGDTIAVRFAGSVHRVPLCIRPELPDGVAGLPAGIPPIEGVTLPAWGTLSRS
ncbi:MAG: NADH-quinone oxidoreductase subunit NuoG [bacterium]